MRPLTLVVFCLLASFLPACRRGQGAGESATHIDSRVRLIMDDGRTVDKLIALKDESDVKNLGQLLGAATGRFVFTITTRRTNDKFEQHIEGRLEKGLLEGKVSTYIILGADRHLSSEVTYLADVLQGPFISYYPMEGQPQMRGSFDEGKKHGAFIAFYLGGKVAVRMYYNHDDMDGLCEVYDSAGTLVASGTYKKGTPESGTFIEDLNAFIRESVDSRPIVVRIATVNEPGKSSTVVERTLNPKKSQ